MVPCAALSKRRRHLLPCAVCAALPGLARSQPKAPDYATAFKAIGPAAVKLGQTLATRPDLVGEEAARNLLSLQDQLPPVSFDLVQAQIEASLGKPLAALFKSVDPVAVGSASIAQVHRGVTIEGRDVAIKVLRPGIDKQFLKGHRHL